MADLNWNLLNTNAPAQVAASFRPVEVFQEGVGQAQKMRMNELAMQKMQQDMEYAPAKLYAQQMKLNSGNALAEAKTGKARAEMGLKELELGMRYSGLAASAPPGQVLPTALRGVEEMGLILRKTPEEIEAMKQETTAKYSSLPEDQLRQTLQANGMKIKEAMDLQLKRQQVAQGGERVQQGWANVGLGAERNQIAAGNLAVNQQNAATNQMRANQPNIQYINTGAEQVPINKKAPLSEQSVLANTPKPGQDMGPSLTQEEIDVFGERYNLTGQMPQLGYGAKAANTRIAIAKSAAAKALGLPKDLGGKTPSEAALGMLSKQTDTKAIQGSLNFLDKQISAMGSFAENLGMQVDKVGQLAKDLETADARLLNVPLRAVRGRLAGSDLQAKYDMYLTEISSEIAKLSTGSSASIAELSVSAREKWEKIHDPNLSVKDMMSLLKETKEAAAMRVKSVEDQLQKTRARMVNRQEIPTSAQAVSPAAKTPPAGWVLMEDAAGNKAYVSPDGKEFQEVQ